MSNGGEQPTQSTSVTENVGPTRNGGGSTEIADANVDNALSEEKERVFCRVKSSQRWRSSGRESAPDSKSHHTLPTSWANGEEYQTRRMSVNARQRPNVKRIREEVEDLLDQVSRGELEGEDTEP